MRFFKVINLSTVLFTAFFLFPAFASAYSISYSDVPSGTATSSSPSNSVNWSNNTGNNLFHYCYWKPDQSFGGDLGALSYGDHIDTFANFFGTMSGTYWIMYDYVVAYGPCSQWTTMTDAINNNHYAGQFIGLENPGFVDTSSHIASTSPYDNETVATTSELGASWYVNSTDYESGMMVHVSLYNQTTNATAVGPVFACAVFNGTHCSYDFAVTASSTTQASSTLVTYNYPGTVHATWTITKPTLLSSLWLVGGLFSPDVIYATTTVFIVGYSSALDQSISNGGAAITNYLLTGTTTPLLDFTSCQFSSFSVSGCAVAMIIPSQASLSQFAGDIYSQVLVKWPWGYLTRFATIFMSTSTTALPEINDVLPPGVAGAGTPIVLDPFNEGLGTSSLVNTATTTDTGQTLRQIVEPWWNLIWLAATGVTIVLFFV